MRLMTWNCCRGSFESKLLAAEWLQADVLVLTECSKPAASTENCVWVGTSGTSLGVAVLTRGRYRLRELPASPVAPAFLMPVEVLGPLSFTLLAAWTVSEHKYIRGLNQGLAAYEGLIRANDTIIAGDFNSNAKWDKEHPKQLNHSAMLRAMTELSLESAYHVYTSEKQGEETQPTFYHYRKSDKPFHIDYCFVPKAWTSSIQEVSVGRFDEWHKLSDHCPLLVDIAER